MLYVCHVLLIFIKIAIELPWHIFLSLFQFFLLFLKKINNNELLPVDCDAEINLDIFSFPFFFAASLGKRHFVTFMLFLGMANAYVMRTNMSVAIVAMVNHTAIGGESEVVDDECPNNDYGNSTVRILLY